MTDQYIEDSLADFENEYESDFYALIQQLEEALPKGEKVEKPRFKIDDIEKAEWALKKIALHEREIEKFKQHMDQEVDRIKAWFERTKEGNEYYINLLKGLLLPYAEEQLKDSPKKSLSLSQGTMSFRKGTPQYLYKDEDLMKYIKDNKMTNYIKEEVKWGDFKGNLKLTKDGRVMTKDGEVLNFISVSIPDDGFYVKVTK